MVVVDQVPDAYDIFARTRMAITAAQYPDSIDYTISIAGSDGEAPRTNHYRANSRPANGVIHVASISEEEEAKPPTVPHGVNFALTAAICGGRCDTGSAHLELPVGPPPSSQDLIGVPILDPTYMFGLKYSTDQDRDAREKLPANLPVIATVSATTREYEIAFAGLASVDGTACYHLRLEPLHDRHRNRLRELWIGRGDFFPKRALLAGNFTTAPLVDVPWDVQFTVLNGAPFITREAAVSTLYLTHRRIVRDASISFDAIRPADVSPIGRPLIEPEASEDSLVEPNH
ncbi:MAG: hypothetical protein JOZ77_12580 [Candidatus Eremiobacteraeota bacterium]|nr:hypothetical protein [Candidatus Eremiobacteraeota bacterium]